MRKLDTKEFQQFSHTELFLTPWLIGCISYEAGRADRGDRRGGRQCSTPGSSKRSGAGRRRSASIVNNRCSRSLWSCPYTRIRVGLRTLSLVKSAASSSSTSASDRQP